jgi:hypothetical protein
MPGDQVGDPGAQPDPVGHPGGHAQFNERIPDQVLAISQQQPAETGFLSLPG